MNFLGYNDTTLVFHSKSGPLSVHREGDIIYLDFPSWKPERISDYPEWLTAVLGEQEILGVYRHRDMLVELQDAKAVAACTPDFYLFDAQHSLVYRGQFDTSRPANGIPVTGSDLRRAVDNMLAGKTPLLEQRPSIGCNIKWAADNAPEYFTGVAAVE